MHDIYEALYLVCDWVYIIAYACRVLVFYLWVSKVPVNDNRRYACDIFCYKQRLCLAMDKNGPCVSFVVPYSSHVKWSFSFNKYCFKNKMLNLPCTTGDRMFPVGYKLVTVGNKKNFVTGNPLVLPTFFGKCAKMDQRHRIDLSRLRTKRMPLVILLK